ncbi:MAG: adenylosuccinate synthase [Candidatus Poseidoniaceae archaeon]|jgi:adenylosuccinate synthase|nr:adenylosuccinate synthase [Candidatus Poseidoniaceae archaeon]MDP7000304.1 adenylosuccinate synthase [Candidatus Poseidoniaceae archaeon]
MPASVVLGAQWGDEGKGKLVDRLAGSATWVARFQGGNNAGHTVVLGERVIKLHLLPSGITRKECNLVLGDGMVIDPWVLREELDSWQEQTGEDPTGERLYISERAHVILPYHRMLDGLDKKIGTTGRGIGPTYADKINRIGLRFADLGEVEGDSEWAIETAARMNADLSAAGADGRVSADELSENVAWINQTFGKAVANTGVMLDNALKMGEDVLLEGAQGCLLDIDQGTFPFVTSSVTSRGNATHGAGIHPGHIGEVIGIVKAYTTRVGSGPFPTELLDDVGDHMTDIGHEFGTTTGRRRRCGWLDIVVLRHAHRVNGFTGLAMTKLDVLGGLDPLKICIGYRLDGKEIHEMPASSSALARCEPILIEMPGFPEHELSEWLEIAIKSNEEGLGYSVLPSAAQSYIRHVEKLLGVPITSVGVGPDRDATIDRAD